MEEPSQESHHSIEHLLATDSSSDSPLSLDDLEAEETVGEAKLKRINWPRMDAEKTWKDLDSDLSSIIQTTMQGGVEKKVKTFTTMLARVGAVAPKKTTSTQITGNWRENEIRRCRNEMKDLERRYRQAPDEEIDGIKQLQQMLREKIRRLRAAERTRRAKKERSRKRSQFIRDPYKFTKDLLGGERSGTLKSGKREVEQHLSDVHSNECKGLTLGECDRIEPVSEPSIPLDEREPTWKEVQEVVKKARSGSAPGPNGIPYKVYKKYPKLLRILWQLLKKVWKKGAVPTSWRRAEGCFVPKEKDSSTVKQFRTISLLNVEGKIFFSVFGKRMAAYMTNNDYVDTSIQKGGIPGFSGCAEHTSVISQLREAKEQKGDLTCVWLVLANAYRSVPHELIKTAISHYHIPAHVVNITNSYFRDIKLQFTFQDITTKWQDLERGIVTGCTISPILFVMWMNLIIKAAERETRGPRMQSGIYIPIQQRVYG